MDVCSSEILTYCPRLKSLELLRCRWHYYHLSSSPLSVRGTSSSCPTRTDEASGWHFGADKSPRSAARATRWTRENIKHVNRWAAQIRWDGKDAADITTRVMTLSRHANSKAFSGLMVFNICKGYLNGLSLSSSTGFIGVEISED